MRRWSARTDGPARADLEEIASVIRGGGVVILPTDTLYGLHARADDAAAIGRIYATKERGDARPLLVICAGASQLRELGAALSPELETALNRLWPAALTAIVPLREPIPPSAGGTTIGARVPDVPWLRELLTMTGPLASTSVNRSGGAPLIDPSELPGNIASGADGMVDAGPLEGAPSTIVDFTEEPPRIVREGAFFFTQKLWKTVRKTL
jgi:tRNA threonylcarbamoyl adenosine modification protein (Sua5/YciO/YrdC/YwlC family)